MIKRGNIIEHWLQQQSLTLAIISLIAHSETNKCTLSSIIQLMASEQPDRLASVPSSSCKQKLEVTYQYKLISQA
jgi:hypothetical protein